MHSPVDAAIESVNNTGAVAPADTTSSLPGIVLEHIGPPRDYPLVNQYACVTQAADFKSGSQKKWPTYSDVKRGKVHVEEHVDHKLH